MALEVKNEKSGNQDNDARARVLPIRIDCIDIDRWISELLGGLHLENIYSGIFFLSLFFSSEKDVICWEKIEAIVQARD